MPALRTSFDCSTDSYVCLRKPYEYLTPDLAVRRALCGPGKLRIAPPPQGCRGTRLKLYSARQLPKGGGTAARPLRGVSFGPFDAPRCPWSATNSGQSLWSLTGRPLPPSNEIVVENAILPAYYSAEGGTCKFAANPCLVSQRLRLQGHPPARLTRPDSCV